MSFLKSPWVKAVLITVATVAVVSRVPILRAWILAA